MIQRIGYCQSTHPYFVYQNEPKQTAEVPQCPVCNLRQANEMSKSNLQKDVEMNRFNVDPIPVNLPHQETQEIRTKSLDLACSLYNTAYYDRSEGNKPIIDIAKRFYTYITKGE